MMYDSVLTKIRLNGIPYDHRIIEPAFSAALSSSTVDEEPKSQIEASLRH